MRAVRTAVFPYSTEPISHGLGTVRVQVAVYSGTDIVPAFTSILSADQVQVRAGLFDLAVGAWSDMGADTIVVVA